MSAYFAIVRRQRWLILGIAVFCGAVAFGVSEVQKKTYSATASLAVSDPNQGLNLVGGGSFSAVTPLQLASAAEPLVTRPEVVARVKQTLGSPLSLDALRNAVTTSIDPTSYLVNVSVSDPSGARAARIANAFANADAAITTAQTRAQYRAQADAVRRQLNHAPAAVQGTTAFTLARLENLSGVATPLQVNAAATVPTSPSSPKPTRNTVAALIIGLFIGIAIAVARDALDRRLRHASDVTAELNHPIVGQIRTEALGHAGASRKQGNDGIEQMADPDEESFRILRQNVSFLAAEDKDRTVLVTSAMAEEGKSTVAACLATAFAEAGKRTLLVECDLRRPVFARRLGLNQSPGLTDYLTGNAQPHEILQQVPVITVQAFANGHRNGAAAHLEVPSADLVCITAGSDVPRPAELLDSDNFRAFLHEVGQVYDAVVLDTAPLLPVADTLGIIPEASSVLLCVRLRQTTRDQARSAQSALDRLPSRPLALVLTGVGENEEGYYGYYGSSTPVAEHATAGA